MATSSDDELSQIGKALAAAAGGEPVELTDEQARVLARAAFPDTLDAILAHVPIRHDYSSQRLIASRIARAWSDKLSIAFRLPTIANEIREDNSIQAIRSVVSQDDRLSKAERQELRHALPNLERDLARLSSSPLSRRAYLSSISVEGFRGIGPHASLPLEPQRGLTLIYGANGSGKSTFVEALDVLLTGNTARFAGRGQEWRSAWANAHSPDRGQIDVEFVVENRDTQRFDDDESSNLFLVGFAEEARDAQRDMLTRDWTAADLSAATSEKDNPLGGLDGDDPRQAAAAGEKDDSLGEPVRRIGRLDVAEAIDKFRPILGYGELGPLFEESGSVADPDTGNVTLFAQHIRTRANVRDETTDALEQFIKQPADPSGVLYDELVAWQEYITSTRKGAKEAESLVSSAVAGDATAKSTLRSPSDWDWQALAIEHTEDSSDSPIRASSLRELLTVARAYSPRFSDSIRESVTQLVAQRARNLVRSPEYRIHRMYMRERGWVDPTEVELDEAQLETRDVHERVERFFAYQPSRAKSYAEMLLDEILSARLEQFSQRVSDIWGKIRPGSNGVQFDALSLQRYHTIDEGSSPAQEIRVSLDLTIDGDRPIERGALSQGELHSLALSVFLPTLMMPGSPFGFAVIDDPVQAMDSYAVDGLAKVLRDAAEELQVVVFTHDERLPRALRLLDIEHTLINIARSPGSKVLHEVALDPVIRALENARIEAQDAGENSSDSSWMDVGVHCREAVEQACIKAVTQRLRKAGLSLLDIQRELDDAVYNERLTVRKLMALAIGGKTAHNPDRVAGHVTQHEKGGAWINAAIDHVNALFHRNREQVPAIRNAYDNELGKLVERTRKVVQWIEENCG